MHPVYFGSSEAPLFAVYYLPHGNTLSARGVVLCHPFGQEYLWMHRAYRQLAWLFARSGFHVLRFDYYGCGDSAGEKEDGSVKQWLVDIATAIEEIKDAGSLRKVSLVGFRLGATLATLVAAQRDDVEKVVLWDPVYSGDSYIEELHAMHRHWMTNNLPQPAADTAQRENHGEQEVIGFPLTDSLRKEFASLDLLSLPARVSGKVCLIESRDSSQAAALQERMQLSGTTVDRRSFDASEQWVSSAGLDPLSVPSEVLQTIVAWTGDDAL